MSRKETTVSSWVFLLEEIKRRSHEVRVYTAGSNHTGTIVRIDGSIVSMAIGSTSRAYVALDCIESIVDLGGDGAVSGQDELIVDVLKALRGMQGAYQVLLAACDNWVDAPDSGLDPDASPAFDERGIVQEHLGQIRAGIDSLLRMLAAVKGKHALAALVQID